MQKIKEFQLDSKLNCFKSTSVLKIEKYGWCCTPQLLSQSEVSIMLLSQLCSTCYAAVQIETCWKSILLCNQGSYYEKYAVT